MTAEATESQALDIGRVLAGTFRVIGRNFVTFAILGLVLAGLPTWIMTFVQVSWLSGQAEDIAAGNISISSGYIRDLGFSGLVAIVTTAILQGALIFATVQDLNGQKPRVGEALATGLRNFLGLIVLSILFALAVGLGMVLLIVPGVMIACAWCVAAPSLVADRTGIFAAFSRSAELTRGNRWRIFGLFLVLLVLLILVAAVLGAVSAAAIFADPSALQDPPAAASNPVSIALNIAQHTISSVIGATLTAVLYVELRKAREGAGPQWLAEIFS